MPGTGLKVDIEGADMLLQKLRAMPPRTAKGAMRKSLIAGAEVIATAVRGQTPVHTGLARSAVGVRSQAAKGSGFGSSAAVIFDTGKFPDLLKVSKRTGKSHLYIAIVHYRKGRYITRATEGARQAAINRIVEVLRQTTEADFLQ